MERKRIKEWVTFGRLRFFPATDEGVYPVSGRLECLGCEPGVTLLFHHAGLEQDLSALQAQLDSAVEIDRQHEGNWVAIGPTRGPEESGRWGPTDLFGCCMALLDPPKESRCGYEFEACVKPAGPHDPVTVQFSDTEYPRHFFRAVTFQGDTAVVLECGTPYAQRYMSRRQFEDEIGSSPRFGALLAGLH
jgi:hypothetical protein